MNIKLLQFTNGDVIIGDLNYDQIKNPFILTYFTHKEEDGPVLSLTPYVLFAEDHTLSINPNNVVWRATPNKYMIEDYKLAMERTYNPPNETTA